MIITCALNIAMSKETLSIMFEDTVESILVFWVWFMNSAANEFSYHVALIECDVWHEVQINASN